MRANKPPSSGGQCCPGFGVSTDTEGKRAGTVPWSRGFRGPVVSWSRGSMALGTGGTMCVIMATSCMWMIPSAVQGYAATSAWATCWTQAAGPQAEAADGPSEQVV